MRIPRCHLRLILGIQDQTYRVGGDSASANFVPLSRENVSPRPAVKLTPIAVGQP